MVRWSAPAKADLRSIFEYISRDSPHYARKVTQEIVAKVDVLNDLPKIGRVVPEIGEPAVRELSLYSYRILYEIHTDHIDILAVIHKRRDVRGEEIGR